MTAHTPGPWQVIRRLSDLQSGIDVYVGVPDRRDEMKDYSLRYAEQHVALIYSGADEREANAAFIVKACNAHDTIVSVLRAIDGHTALVGSDLQKQISGALALVEER